MSSFIDKDDVDSLVDYLLSVKPFEKVDFTNPSEEKDKKSKKMVNELKFDGVRMAIKSFKERKFNIEEAVLNTFFSLELNRYANIEFELDDKKKEDESKKKESSEKAEAKEVSPVKPSSPIIPIDLGFEGEEVVSEGTVVPPTTPSVSPLIPLEPITKEKVEPNPKQVEILRLELAKSEEKVKATEESNKVLQKQVHDLRERIKEYTKSIMTLPPATESTTIGNLDAKFDLQKKIEVMFRTRAYDLSLDLSSDENNKFMKNELSKVIRASTILDKTAASNRRTRFLEAMSLAQYYVVYQLFNTLDDVDGERSKEELLNTEATKLKFMFLINKLNEPRYNNVEFVIDLMISMIVFFLSSAIDLKKYETENVTLHIVAGSMQSESNALKEKSEELVKELERTKQESEKWKRDFERTKQDSDNAKQQINDLKAEIEKLRRIPSKATKTLTLDALNVSDAVDLGSDYSGDEEEEEEDEGGETVKTSGAGKTIASLSKEEQKKLEAGPSDSLEEDDEEKTEGGSTKSKDDEEGAEGSNDDGDDDDEDYEEEKESEDSSSETSSSSQEEESDDEDGNEEPEEKEDDSGEESETIKDEPDPDSEAEEIVKPDEIVKKGEEGKLDSEGEEGKEEDDD
jgi:hypothetical protein